MATKPNYKQALNKGTNHMKRILSIAAIAAACAFADAPTCGTQTIPICTVGSPAGDVQIKPQAVPTSTGTVTAYDAYLKSVTVTNTTAGAITFTLSDKQASPIALLSAVSIPANTTYVIVFPNPQWCPGGFTVIAGGAGLNYSVSWRQ